jgi:signal transduction histidine kinase/DNA-binding response OmpR family regulator/CHASE3 domain sensor protein
VRNATLLQLKRLALLLMAAGLFGMAITIYLFVSSQLKVSRQVAISTSAEAFLSALKDVETSYRGYVITGAETYLEPYKASSDDVALRLQDLSKALRDEEKSAGPAQQLSTLATGVTTFANRVIEARQRAVEEARILVRGGQGKSIMDEIRATIAQLVAEARAESFVAERRMRAATWLGVVALSLTALAGLFFWLVTRATGKSAVRARSAMRDLIVNAPLGVAMMNGAGVITQHNESFAMLARRRPDGLVGQRAADIVPATLAAKGAATEFQMESGEEDHKRYVTGLHFPVPVDDDGRGRGIILVDVTQQQRWAQELEEAKSDAEAANRAKSAFIANMSHELRTPLTAVLGYCELIEDELSEENHPVLPDLQKIMLNARHLLALISDILDLSKIEARRLDISPSRFSLAKLLADVEASSASLAITKKNDLIFEKTPDDIMLETDALRLKQVLLNLVSNATKFTEAGTITVRSEALEENGEPHVRLTVEDNGIGMSPEQLSKLFTRFRQADETTTRRFGGTGLGLALTQELVHAMGGRIEVESEIKVGSRFVVTLPTIFRPVVDMPDDDDRRTEGVAVHAGEDGTAGPPVLIVDDQSSQRDVLSRLLKKEGYAVATAANGVDALAFLKRSTASAILLDIRMPGMDGWQVLKAIRGNARTAKIPVIVQTVLDEQRFAFALGASAYLKKPVSRQDLAAILPVITADVVPPRALLVGVNTALSEIKANLIASGWSVEDITDTASALMNWTPGAYRAVIVDVISRNFEGLAFLHMLGSADQRRDTVVLLLTESGLVANSTRNQSLPHQESPGAEAEEDVLAQLRSFLPPSQALEQKGRQP